MYDKNTLFWQMQKENAASIRISTNTDTLGKFFADCEKTVFALVSEPI